MAPTLSITEAFEKWADDLIRYATVLVGADDADDAVHEAFVDVMASGRWGAVREPRGYLFRAVLNASRAMRRSGRRREAREWRTRPRQLAHLELLADPEVLAAVNELSVQQRAVTYLTYWEDMTPAAVAEVLDVSEGSVRKQLNRARKALREVLA